MKLQAFAIGLLLIDVLAFGPALADQRPVITVSDLRADPEGGLVAQEILFFFHDGSFDLFDFGEPARSSVASYVEEGDWTPLFDEASAAGHAVWRLRLIPGSLNGPFYPESNSPIGPPPPPDTVPPLLAPQTMPHFSFLVRFHPGDDLFLANEDPARYRLFDPSGAPVRSSAIDLVGADLLDAGVRFNDELDLFLVDGFDPPSPALEDGVVQPHPGFAGAARQGADTAAGRLLTSPLDGCADAGCPVYDPAELDFTEPGSRLMRISIGTEATHLDGTLSGSYYDPARAGEGFSIDVIGSDPDRIVLYWYTYTPDGSGEPLWLVGQGEKSENATISVDPFGYPDYQLVLYTTSGGDFPSVGNPANVQLEPWGTARLGLDPVERAAAPTPSVGCEQLRLYAIEPDDETLDLDLPPTSTISDDPPIEGREYVLTRLGPDLTGAPPVDCRLLGLDPEGSP